MSKRIFRLVHEVARRNAIAAVSEAPEGWVVTLSEPTRNLEQNAKLHTALAAVAAQVYWHGKRLDALTWKRLCTAAWLRESGEQPQLIPALDGNGFDVIYEHTSKLSKTQCSALIEWILLFGAEHGVNFGAMEEGI